MFCWVMAAVWGLCAFLDVLAGDSWEFSVAISTAWIIGGLIIDAIREKRP